jgi:hypothetical protein
MRTSSIVGTAAVLSLGLLGCGDSQPTEPETFVIPVYARSAESLNFGTHLVGAEENPPVPTDADGQAVLKLSSDGTSMHYKVITNGLTAITQSHIHIGPVGVNGPIVVFLFGFVAGGVTQDGILAEGDFTAANLIARPAIGFGATMPELIASLRTGGAYVNVHTVANPGGAIRGQVEEHGPTR